jgi:hypothetical protein
MTYPLFVFQDGRHIENAGAKTMQFSVYHTKSYLQHKIGDCCVMFCDGRTDASTDRRKKLKQYIRQLSTKCGYNKFRLGAFRQVGQE